MCVINSNGLLLLLSGIVYVTTSSLSSVQDQKLSLANVAIMFLFVLCTGKGTTVTRPVDISRLDIRVGVIVSVEKVR